MKAKLVKIGNSRGIRLPKPIIEQVGLEDEVELEVREGEVAISPAGTPRSGWAEAARALAAKGDDEMLDEPTPTDFDEQESSW